MKLLLPLLIKLGLCSPLFSQEMAYQEKLEKYVYKNADGKLEKDKQFDFVRLTNGVWRVEYEGIRPSATSGEKVHAAFRV